MNQDEEHLRLLAIFHYVVAGLMALFACFPIIHLTVGILMLTGVLDGPSDPEMRLMGLFFVVFPGAFILVGWALAICIFLAGRNLARRQRYMFCFVMGAVMCLFTPVGTVLGVFTILVLMRPSVKELFGLQPRPEGGPSNER